MASAPDEQSTVDSETSTEDEVPDPSTKEPAETATTRDTSAPSNDEVSVDLNKPANLFGNHSVSICSPFGVQNSARPVFGSSSRSILKPSSLFTDATAPSPSVTFGNNMNKSVKLKPSVLSNPFVNTREGTDNENQVSDCDDSKNSLPHSEKPDSTNDDSTSSTTTASTPVFVPLSNPSSSNTNTSAVTSTTNNTASITVSSNQSSAETTSNTPSSTSVSTEFVFGQNLHERVNVKSESAEPEPVPQNGITSSEMLFRSAIKQDSSSHGVSNGNTKTLSVSAREYEEARSVKRKYEEVAVVTGEEDEINILQINCKLHQFDNAISSWSERGRGTLRVNDRDSSEGRTSRLIMRLLGNLRVVVNTPIWSGMTAELASKNSVRLTAIDNDGQVRIYLVSANSKDSEQLYNVLSTRIQKKRLKTTSESKPKTKVDV